MVKQKVTNAQVMNTVLTQANAGTAGGTINYINEGGIKKAWGYTAAYSVAGNTAIDKTVTLPGSFFASITGAKVSGSELTVDGRQTWYFSVAPTAATVTLTVQGLTGSATAVGGKFYWEVIGT